MKVLNKVLSVVLIIVVILAMVAFHLTRKANEHQVAVSVQSTQESIGVLEKEKLELEARLAGAVDDREDGTDSEGQGSQQTEPMQAVLCQNALEDDELKTIQLLPYDSDLLEENMSQVNGYCGLEVWASWKNDTDENLQYSKDKMLQLLESGSIELKGLDNLVALTASADAENHDDGPDMGKCTTEEQIQTRIAEIEDEIEQLYQ